MKEIENLNLNEALLPSPSELKKLAKREAKKYEKLEKIKVALLTKSTSLFFSHALKNYLLFNGYDADLYEGSFDQLEYEFLDKNSDLYKFNPSVIFLIEDHTIFPDYGGHNYEALLEVELDKKLSYWREVKKKLNAKIIQANIVVPLYDPYSNFSYSFKQSKKNTVEEYNYKLKNLALENEVMAPYLFDMNTLACELGLRKSYDLRRYAESKTLYSVEFTQLGCFNFLKIFLALKGKAKKCLILDLDNTLWGGVIGDDGLDGIKLGQGDPIGECFINFQKYIKDLKNRGIILALCSKNNLETAKEVFTSHDEIPIKWDDISAYRINWQNKAQNVSEIISELNIGYDSVVFIDDNPLECQIVREHLPDVSVLELPKDPSEFIGFVHNHKFFETLGITDEDRKRSSYYASNLQRKELQSSFVDMDAFLKSLEMKATLRPIDSKNITRATQLINKSNQWNLTTIRYEKETIKKISEDSKYITLTTRLTDRFGDNGIISVLLGKISNSELEVETWVMSCRVLNRNVEKMIMNQLFKKCLEKDINMVKGKYIPTKKNSLVENLYKNLGFNQESKKNGEVLWTCKVNNSLKTLME